MGCSSVSFGKDNAINAVNPEIVSGGGRSKSLLLYVDVIQITQGAGLQTLILKTQAQKTTIKIIQGYPTIAPPLADDIQSRILVALGLNISDLDQRFPIAIVSTGHSKVLIGITSPSRLETLLPDLSRLTEISREIGCNGYFVFVLENDPDAKYLSNGRMFAPAIGIAEDPVTGNANGPLALI